MADGERRTYAEMEARANRLAHFLAAQGIGPGDHVGIYSLNSVEWVETAWAVFKLRAVWININYRYVKDELRYLFTNADLVALVHQREFSPLVADAAARAPRAPPLVVIVDDGSGQTPAGGRGPLRGGAWRRAGPSATSRPRSGDDLYILYTGGHHRACPRAWCGATRTSSTRSAGASTPHQHPRGAARGDGGQGRQRRPAHPLPIAPLMHGATQWSVMGQSFVGNRIVLVPKFDPHEVWRLVEREKVNSVMITGDAMGKPLIESLDDPGADYDLSSLLAITSSAALFSAPVKDEFFEHLPNLVITDAIGSSEAGNNGMHHDKPATPP